MVLSDDDSSSVVSVLSEPSSDDDGHSECARKGYCQDDYFSKDREDSDVTVVDVFNTNQALFPGEQVSEDESSGFSNPERSGEDGFESDEGEIRDGPE